MQCGGPFQRQQNDRQILKGWDRIRKFNYLIKGFLASNYSVDTVQLIRPLTQRACISDVQYSTYVDNFNTFVATNRSN